MAVITRRADYAARIMLHLAQLSAGTWTTTDEIARQEFIPKRMIRQIMARLGSVGMVRTRRGSGGGIALVRDATAISLMDIVEAMEGPFTLNDCIADERICPLVFRCLMRGALAQAERILVEELREQTLDKLVSRNAMPETSEVSENLGGLDKNIRRK